MQKMYAVYPASSAPPKTMIWYLAEGGRQLIAWSQANQPPLLNLVLAEMGSKLRRANVGANSRRTSGLWVPIPI
jgi:hypothetical protein